MLRKALSSILALLACALVVAGFDGARHAMASNRLAKHGASLGDWHYRIGGSQAADPDNAKIKLVAWWRRLLASPRSAFLQHVVVDESVARDLATVHMEKLGLANCQGMSPATMVELSGISSIRCLTVINCGVTDEGLQRIWTGLPGLEVLGLIDDPLSEDAFRNIKRARKLKQLTLWQARGVTDQVIVRLREAPGLEVFTLGESAITEDSVPVFASMPALRAVRLIFEPYPDFNRQLKARNPKLKVTNLVETRS